MGLLIALPVINTAWADEVLITDKANNKPATINLVTELFIAIDLYISIQLGDYFANSPRHHLHFVVALGQS